MRRLLEQHKHSEHGYRACLGLLSLARRHGKERLEAACAIALELGAYQYRDVKNVLEADRDRLTTASPAGRLRARGSEWEGQAAVLARASAHWLRHTAGSHMTDQQVDLRYVRDNFGHASIATTSGYLHSEEDARHEVSQERHRVGWGAASKQGA